MSLVESQIPESLLGDTSQNSPSLFGHSIDSLPVHQTPTAATPISGRSRSSGAIDFDLMHQMILRGTTTKELMETFNVSKGTINGATARRGWYLTTKAQPLGEKVSRPRRPKFDEEGNPIVKPPREKKARPPRQKAERKPRAPKSPKPSKAANAGNVRTFNNYLADLRRVPVEQDPRLPNDLFDSTDRVGGMVFDRVEEYAERARSRGLPAINFKVASKPKVMRVMPKAPFQPNPTKFYDRDRDTTQNICRWPTGNIDDHSSNVGAEMEVCGVAIPTGKSYCPHCEMRLYAPQRGQAKPEYSIKSRAQMIAESCDMSAAA